MQQPTSTPIQWLPGSPSVHMSQELSAFSILPSTCFPFQTIHKPSCQYPHSKQPPYQCIAHLMTRRRKKKYSSMLSKAHERMMLTNTGQYSHENINDGISNQYQEKGFTPNHDIIVTSTTISANSANSSSPNAKYISPLLTRTIKTKAANFSDESSIHETNQINTRGNIILPGKFDAFHRGHRKLFTRASAYGNPILVSFTGMAEVLGWEPKKPLVTMSEKERILRQWADAPSNYQVDQVRINLFPFDQIRSLKPKEFIHLLVNQLDARGIVCGDDWRFGYKAQGDKNVLQEICSEMKLLVDVVEPELEGGIVISSTRIRKLIEQGDVKFAATLLGRPYRLSTLITTETTNYDSDNKTMTVASEDSLLTLAPADGMYECVIHSSSIIGTHPVRVKIYTDPQSKQIRVGLFDLNHFHYSCEAEIDFLERIE